MSEQSAGAVTPIVEARDISKHFGHVNALRGVNLQLAPSEVLGVVGDNGAGKSTLMKILSGVHPPSSGEILIDGQPVRFGNPGDARRLGIEMVYQDLALAGNMRIDETIFLGREQTRRFGPISLVKVSEPGSWSCSRSQARFARRPSAFRCPRRRPASPP